MSQAPVQGQVLQDNLTKAKMLMVSLSDSLNVSFWYKILKLFLINCPFQNLFHEAAARVSNEDKNPEVKVSFEKSFEEFYSIVDQIELNLQTSLECAKQTDNSSKYLPLAVNLNPQPNSLTYEQYLAVVGAQINYARHLKSILSFND